MDFHFLKRPNTLLNSKQEFFSDRIVNLLKCVLLLFVVLIAWGIFLYIINVFCLKYYDFSFLIKFQEYQTDRIFKTPSYNGVLLAIVIAPILEEFTYRYSLNLKKRTVIVSFIMLSFIDVGDNIFHLDFHSTGTWLKILVMAAVAFGGYFFIKQPFLNKIKTNYYAFYFYGSALIFAYDHISVFIKILPNTLLIFLPLFVLPQFFLALCASYLRLKNGFIWAVLFHAFFNLPITLKYLSQV